MALSHRWAFGVVKLRKTANALHAGQLLPSLQRLLILSSLLIPNVMYSFIAPWRIFCLTVLSGIIRIVLFDSLGCSLQDVAPLRAFEVLLFLNLDKTGYLKCTDHTHIINTDSSLFLESGDNGCLYSSSCPHPGLTPQGLVGFY